jgi:hypothetical protein
VGLDLLFKVLLVFQQLFLLLFWRRSGRPEASTMPAALRWLI